MNISKSILPGVMKLHMTQTSMVLSQMLREINANSPIQYATVSVPAQTEPQTTAVPTNPTSMTVPIEKQDIENIEVEDTTELSAEDIS